MLMAETCSWCDRDVEPHDGFRLAEPAGSRRAVFCRLEHVIPWAQTGAHWAAGDLTEPRDIEQSLDRCAHCGEPLTDTRIVLIRHRGDHRIPDAFCSVDHLAAWAKKGGRYA